MTIPTQTTKRIEIPLLGEVFLKTLNATEHQEAIEKIQREAGKKIVPYIEGGDGYDSLVSEFKDYGEEGQIAYLLNSNLQKMYFDSMQEHPYPAEPPFDEDADKHAQALKEYEEACQTVDQKRLEYVTWAQEKAEETYRALKPQERLESCSRVFRETKRREWAGLLHSAYILEKAVRDPDNTARLYFDNVSTVLDLKEEVKEALWREYNEIDSVRPDEIPT